MSGDPAAPSTPPAHVALATASPEEVARVGLCARCRHCKRVVSAKGSAFFLCRRSETDARFRKYPPLPVVTCAGYESVTPDTSE